MGTLPDKLIELLATDRKAPVKVGDLVPKWDGAEEYTPVEAIYMNFLGNEVWATSFTLNKHIPQGLTPQRASRILENIPKVLEDPDWVLLDTKKRSCHGLLRQRGCVGCYQEAHSTSVWLEWTASSFIRQRTRKSSSKRQEKGL